MTVVPALIASAEPHSDEASHWPDRAPSRWLAGKVSTSVPSSTATSTSSSAAKRAVPLRRSYQEVPQPSEVRLAQIS